MKKSTRILVSILLGVLIIGTFSVYVFERSRKQDLHYVLEKSYHGDFFIQDDYVIERDVITVKNTTDKNLFFSMFGDFNKYFELFSEKVASAYEDDTFTNNKFYIKANAEQTYTVYFKSKKGPKIKRLDRLPLENLVFKADNASNK